MLMYYGFIEVWLHFPAVQLKSSICITTNDDGNFYFAYLSN